MPTRPLTPNAFPSFIGTKTKGENAIDFYIILYEHYSSENIFRRFFEGIEEKNQRILEEFVEIADEMIFKWTMKISSS